MDEVRVKGLKELDSFLQQLPVEMERNILRGALRAGAQVVANEAKARAPVDTGRLRDSIRIATASKNGRAIAYVKAGGRSGEKKIMQGANGLRVGYEQAYYAMWVEFGTQGHTISARPGGFLNIGGTFVKSVEHPGAKAHPFMRPALDAKAQEAVLATAEYIKRRLSSKKVGFDTSGVEIG